MTETMMPQDAEGVIKFELDRRDGPPPAADLLEELLVWRAVLFRLRLTGQDPARYGGLAYGNVSARLDESTFIISGTQTGGRERLGPEDFCTIEDYDLSQNRVRSCGMIPPSSEALTHAAIYHADANCRCVLHIHSPEIWRHYRSFKLPATPATIPYGTPAMAAAMENLVNTAPGATFAMLGHQDGIISYGPAPETATLNLLRKLGNALIHTSPSAGE